MSSFTLEDHAGAQLLQVVIVDTTSTNWLRDAALLRPVLRVACGFVDETHDAGAPKPTAGTVSICFPRFQHAMASTLPGWCTVPMRAARSAASTTNERGHMVLNVVSPRRATHGLLHLRRALSQSCQLGATRSRVAWTLDRHGDVDVPRADGPNAFRNVVRQRLGDRPLSWQTLDAPHGIAKRRCAVGESELW